MSDKDAKAKAAAQKLVHLLMSDEGRTCLVWPADDKGYCQYLPMASEGLFIHRTQKALLRRQFKFDSVEPEAPASLQRSTIESAARTYVTHYTYAGGSDEALALLETLVTITPQESERIMATKNEKAKKVEKSAKKSAEKKAEKPAKAAKAEKAPKAEKAAGESQARKRTGAANTFKSLIMGGKLTDDEIFAEVQKAHPEVTQDKRHYVSWYRNQLKKQGENPPAALKGKD